MSLLAIGKVVLSAVVIALASELSKKSISLAVVTLALPLTSILALFWIHWEGGDPEKLIEISWGVFWLVPPSLLFFPVFAVLIQKNCSFWSAFALAALATLLFYLGYAKILGLFGVHV